jgi:glycosidase
MRNNRILGRTLRSSSYIVILACVVASVLASGEEAPRVSKVEPPEWWLGFRSPLMVLVTGENLNDARISVSYLGVHAGRIQVQPDGKHAFVWVSIKKTAKPGDVPILVKTSSGQSRTVLHLMQRTPVAGKFQGITQDDVIYLIMPDRFADGDPANNQPKGAAPGTYDRNGAKAYHGGDLKGIQQHLPYLKDLGVTTLWITPLYDNDNSTSDYHGYGAVDEYAVEDHFGTMTDFQDLVSAAHKMNMKVLLDVVPNHVGPKHPWATSQPAPNWLHGSVENHIDNTYDFPPITDPHAVKENYRSALEGWFAKALPDLAQENPLVAEYLYQNALWWAESSGIDGFRIDTFPYVPRSFWAYYLQGLFAIYPHFFAVGEVYNVDPTVTSYFAGGRTGFDGIDTHLPTPFDFPMNSAIREVINHGTSAKKIVDVLRQDRLYPHPELLVTFLGNHDMKRFLTDADGSRAKLELGFSLLATLRGIPQLYYGDEIGMAGGADPDNRNDFPGGFPRDQQSAFTQAGRTPEQQEIYAHVQSLLKLRQQHVALRRGIQKHVAVADRYYAFTRETEGERLLIVFHSGESSASMNLELGDTSMADAKRLTAIFGGSAAQLEGTKLGLQLAPLSLTVYKVD